MIDGIKSLRDANILADAILNTIPDPFVVLDETFRVLKAGRSFYGTFKVSPAEIEGHVLYELGNGQWNIPSLRVLLGKVLSEQIVMDEFVVEHDFPDLGPRIMVLNARRVEYAKATHKTLLLAFDDITERRTIERDREILLRQTTDLLRQKEILLEELQHRVANSLQLIASILTLKARSVQSSETRLHLEDARQRVMTVAAVQKHLSGANTIDKVAIRSYLTTLCNSIFASMVGDQQPIILKVTADEVTVNSNEAVNVGLIVTELLINAIKYAFPEPKADARIVVTYEAEGTNWRLQVADNGIGARPEAAARGSGLGTAIVKALATQLDATVEVETEGGGRRIAVAHSKFVSRDPLSALP